MTKAKKLSNRERADLKSIWHGWELGTCRHKGEATTVCHECVEQALDEAEKRGKIEGQKEMRERAENILDPFVKDPYPWDTRISIYKSCSDENITSH